MKTRILLLLVLILLCCKNSTTVKAQNNSDRDIPICIVNLLGREMYNAQVVGFLRNPAFQVRKDEVLPKETDFNKKPTPFWEGECKDYNFVLRTRIIGARSTITGIVLTAKSNESSVRCFKSLLQGWGLVNNPKANKAIMRKNYYPEKRVDKKGETLHVSFEPFTVYRDSKPGYYVHSVSLKWNLTDKKNPWLEEVVLSGNLNENVVASCFEEKPLKLSRSKLNIGYDRTMWRALGLPLTESNREAFFYHWIGYKFQDSSIVSENGEYVFQITTTGNVSRISAVIHNYTQGYAPGSPIGGGKKITPAEVAKKFSWNYDRSDGFQIYGRDTANPRKSSFYFDLEFKNYYLVKVTVLAEDFANFENDMDLEIEEMLYSKNCFHGNCQNGIGSKYYSDGFWFSGSWYDYKPEYGFVYNRDGAPVDIIDKRLTTEEKEAKTIAKVEADALRMRETIDKIHLQINAYVGNWDEYLRLMGEYHAINKGKDGDMIQIMKNALASIVRCQENCDYITEQAKDLPSLFGKYNFCGKTTLMLKRVELTAPELKKMAYDEMMRMSSYQSASQHQKELKKHEEQHLALHRKLRADYNLVMSAYNECVDAVKGKN